MEACNHYRRKLLVIIAIIRGCCIEVVTGWNDTPLKDIAASVERKSRKQVSGHDHHVAESRDSGGRGHRTFEPEVRPRSIVLT